MAELHVISPTIMPEAMKLRVGAYVRVSTDDEDQENSFINQFDYYSRYIKTNPEWEFVDMYADEHVIIGTSGENLVKSRVSALVPFLFYIKGSPRTI